MISLVSRKTIVSSFSCIVYLGEFFFLKNCCRLLNTFIDSIRKRPFNQFFRKSIEDIKVRKFWHKNHVVTNFLSVTFFFLGCFCYILYLGWGQICWTKILVIALFIGSMLFMRYMYLKRSFSIQNAKASPNNREIFSD